MRWTGWAALLSGCAWVSDGELDRFVDADGDGTPRAPFGVDCDDADPTVNLRTQLDEGGAPVAQWRDGDGDGFGGADEAVGCVLLSGYAIVGGDCDDGDAAVGSGRQQYEDRDGDGFGIEHGALGGCDAAPGFSLVGGDCDDGDASEHPGVDWYADLDGDGVGGERWSSCERPVDAPDGLPLVGVGGDCADEDPAVHPGAEDPAFDGLDQDCAGDTDLDGDDADDLPDLAGDGACTEVFEREVHSIDELRAALAETDVAGACVHLALGAGEYGPGWANRRPTTVRPLGDGAVTFTAAGGGTVGWQAEAPLTLDRVGFVGMDGGAVRGTNGAELLVGGVTLRDGVGVSLKGDAPRRLRLLGVRADGVAALATHPNPVWEEVELANVSARGAVSSEPVLHVRANHVVVRHLRVEGFALLADAFVFEAAGVDADPDLVLEDLTLEGGIVGGGVVVIPDGRVGSARIDGLILSDVEFVTSGRANVGVEVRGPAALTHLSIAHTVVSGDLPVQHLLGVAPDSTVDGATITDAQFASRGSLVHVDRALGVRDGSVTLSDVALGVSTGGVTALQVDAGCDVTLVDSTLVSDFEDLVTAAGPTEVQRALLVHHDGRYGAGLVELRDAVVVGPVPDCRLNPLDACCGALESCVQVEDPGLLRYHRVLSPSAWDLRRRGSRAVPGCPAPAPSAEALAAGALRRGGDLSWYVDDDGDGLLDDQERAFLGALPLVDPDADPDGDGLTTRCELEGTGSFPQVVDTDTDGTPDGADPVPLAP